MAKKAKHIKQSDRVLASSIAKVRKTLSAETVENIIEFYEDNLNSRIISHKSELSVLKLRVASKKYKRGYCLVTLKIYTKNSLTQKVLSISPIGLTKFAELRLKWCIVAGSLGTHSVCVCTTHRNFKAMIELWCSWPNEAY